MNGGSSLLFSADDGAPSCFFQNSNEIVVLLVMNTATVSRAMSDRKHRKDFFNQNP